LEFIIIMNITESDVSYNRIKPTHNVYYEKVNYLRNYVQMSSRQD